MIPRLGMEGSSVPSQNKYLVLFLWVGRIPYQLHVSSVATTLLNDTFSLIVSKISPGFQGHLYDPLEHLFFNPEGLFDFS